MDIKIGGLDHPSVIALLQAHLDDMAPTAPPESRHALDLTGLHQPNIKFYSLWEGEELAGVGALMVHDDTLGEIKSMKTHSNFVRSGVAGRILEHLISEAQSLGLQSVKLETGSMDYFKPAHALYRKHGFEACEPFGDYQPDPNSLFMERELLDEA